MRTRLDLQKDLDKHSGVITECSTTDQDKLYNIFREIVENSDTIPSRDSSREEFQKIFFSQGIRTYVMRICDEVVGGFLIKVNIPGQGGHIANAIYMMGANHRGKGLGKILCESSLHIAKDLGYSAMQYNLVLSQNTHAIQLYKNLGFSILGTVPNAYRNKDQSFQSAHIMHRELE